MEKISFSRGLNEFKIFKKILFSVSINKLENKEASHFEMMEVVKGVTENGFSEITFIENINSTDLQIVTKGAFSLLAKMKN